MSALILELANEWQQWRGLAWADHVRCVASPSSRLGPLSSKVTDFNQFLITDHTHRHWPMGLRGHAKHFNSVRWCHFDSQLGSRKVGVGPGCCSCVVVVVVDWSVQTTRADLARGIATTQAGSGQIVSSRGSYWNSELCTTHDEMMLLLPWWTKRRHQIPGTWKTEYGAFGLHIDLGIDITLSSGLWCCHL